MFMLVSFDLYVICDFDGVACRLNNLMFMIMFRCSRFVGFVYVCVSVWSVCG